MPDGNSPKTIQTTGDLRVFLATLITRVSTGEVDLDSARVQSKLAAQINGSFYTESKMGQMIKEAEMAVPKLGQMPLGGKS